MIFGRFGSPSWGHVGDILAKNKGALWGARVFAVAIAFSVGSGRPRDRFWTDFGASGTDFGPILGRFWADVGRFWDDFWLNFDPIEEASSSIAKLSSASSPKRAGGDTRSVRNSGFVFPKQRAQRLRVLYIFSRTGECITRSKIHCPELTPELTPDRVDPR